MTMPLKPETLPSPTGAVSTPPTPRKKEDKIIKEGESKSPSPRKSLSNRFLMLRKGKDTIDQDAHHETKEEEKNRKKEKERERKEEKEREREEKRLKREQRKSERDLEKLSGKGRSNSIEWTDTSTHDDTASAYDETEESEEESVRDSKREKRTGKEESPRKGKESEKEKENGKSMKKKKGPLDIEDGDDGNLSDNSLRGSKRKKTQDLNNSNNGHNSKKKSEEKEEEDDVDNNKAKKTKKERRWTWGRSKKAGNSDTIGSHLGDADEGTEEEEDSPKKKKEKKEKKKKGKEKEKEKEKEDKNGESDPLTPRRGGSRILSIIHSDKKDKVMVSNLKERQNEDGQDKIDKKKTKKL